jgi:hypothetical protein
MASAMQRDNKLALENTERQRIEREVLRKALEKGTLF